MSKVGRENLVTVTSTAKTLAELLEEDLLEGLACVVVKNHGGQNIFFGTGEVTIETGTPMKPDESRLFDLGRAAMNGYKFITNADDDVSMSVAQEGELTAIPVTVVTTPTVNLI